MKFLKNRKREVLSSIFAFKDHSTLTSYVSKLNRSVILLSTDRHDDAIEDEYKHKPEIILDYNRCEG